MLLTHMTGRSHSAHVVGCHMTLPAWTSEKTLYCVHDVLLTPIMSSLLSDGCMMDLHVLSSL